MRNLKRALSLTLASVMLLGMMVVGSSAASFPDVDENDNIEAIDVLETVKVMVGNENGNFEPDKNVTRAEMAVVMAELLNLDYDYYVTTCPFNDVPQWAKGYVGACAANGIVSGRGDGVYDPNATVTAVEAASMMMRALGYFKYSSDYAGGFEASTVAQASKINLFAGINGNANTPLTRNQVAQLALNTLEATIVDAKKTSADVSVGSGDTAVNITGSVEYNVRTSTEPFARAINRDDQGGAIDGRTGWTVQLGEQLYKGDLRKDGDTDSYGRPSDTWSMKGIKIGTYAQAADFSYTAAASGDTATDKVRNMGLSGYDTQSVLVGTSGTSYPPAKFYVDGRNMAGETFTKSDGTTDGTYLATGSGAAYTKQRNLEHIALSTGNGTLVEIYLNDSNANLIDTVVVTHTQLMQVNRVSKNSVSLKRVESMGQNVADVKPDNSCFDALSKLKADDYVLVTVYKDGSSYFVGTVAIPETTSGNITEVSLNKTGATNGVTVGDTSYSMSELWQADGGKSKLDKNSVSATVESTAFLDTYGYAIFVKNIKGSTAYILFDESWANTVGGRIHYFAQGYDMDGNEVALDMGTNSGVMTDREPGHVYAYKVAESSSSNAEYEWDGAKQSNVGTKPGATISAVDSTLVDGGTRLYTSGVKFIYLTGKNNTPWNNSGYDLDKITVKSGVQKIDTPTTIQYVLNGDGNVSTVIVTNDAELEISSEVLYVSRVTKSVIKDGKKVSQFEGYVGEEFVEGTADKEIIANQFYSFSETNGEYRLNAYSNDNRVTAVGFMDASFTPNSADLKRVEIVNKYVRNAPGNDVGEKYVPGLTKRDGSVIVIDDDLDLTGTVVIDVSGDGYNLGSVGEMTDETNINAYKVAMIFNNSEKSSTRGKVAYLYIWDTKATTNSDKVTLTDGTAFHLYKNAAGGDALTAADGGNDGSLYVGQTLYLRATAANYAVSGSPLVSGTTTIGTGLVYDSTVIEPSATAAAIYRVKVTGNIDISSLNNTNKASFKLTVADADTVQFSETSNPFTPLAKGEYDLKTVFVRAKTAGQKITAADATVTVKADAVVAASGKKDDANDAAKAIYEATLVAAASNSSFTVAADTALKTVTVANGDTVQFSLKSGADWATLGAGAYIFDATNGMYVRSKDALKKVELATSGDGTLATTPVAAPTVATAQPEYKLTALNDSVVGASTTDFTSTANWFTVTITAGNVNTNTDVKFTLNNNASAAVIEKTTGEVTFTVTADTKTTTTPTAAATVATVASSDTGSEMTVTPAAGTNSAATAAQDSSNKYEVKLGVSATAQTTGKSDTLTITLTKVTQNATISIN